MIDVDFNSKIKTKAKLMPISIVSFAIIAASNKFCLGKSIESGLSYFEYSNGSAVFKNAGFGGFNTIGINTSYNYDRIDAQPHEVVHNLQFREYYVFNTFLKKTRLVQHIEKSERGLVKFIKNSIYPDLHYFSVPYYLSKSLSKNYFDNIFELEAQHIALNKYIH